MGIAAVKGFQGDSKFTDKKKVIATLKHFAAHGQPESGSNCGPANISERVLRDTFLRPFKDAIEKAGAISVMASYNEIDGIPSHANKWLLKDVLRDEWGFKGYIVSDYFAITELNYYEKTVSHHLAKDKKDAAILAINAGVNIELPDRDCYPYLKELVEENIIEESVLDELIAVLLEYKFKLGLFDDPYVDPKAIDNVAKLAADRELALKAAHQTVTLLKNENNLLPLDKNKSGKIAVIGPNANRVMLGGYSGTPGYYTSVLEGIKKKFSNDSDVLYSEGCKITVNGSWNEDAVTPSDPEEDAKLIKEAVKVAEQADTIVLVLGGNEQTSREAWNKEHMGDRASLDLVGKQNELVAEMLKTGKPVIVFLFNGRPLSINFINENVPAIVECWYLGQEAGIAVADVLFGDFNPGGKLPVSFPRSAGHVPCHYNHKPSSRRGYLFDKISPLYPFGYGLSYTTFEFSDVKLERNNISKNESTKVSVNIKNTGTLAGEEVVQLYIHDSISSVTRPVKELKGLKRVRLAPGESVKVEFPISTEHLAFTNIDKVYTVEPGEFEIMVGNSSRDEDLKTVILTVL
jgi:beta-glucosidase